ncbi:MAG: putative Ig domain-containing protein [Pseudomonadota bacterium]
MVSVNHANAALPVSDCLSNNQITKLAKLVLPEILAIDNTVTLNDVKIVIKSVGECVTAAEADISLDEYAATLSTDSPPSNSLPEISGTPITYGAEGALYNFTPTSSDPDGDSLSFKIVNQPGWASFSTTTGTLSGSPAYTDAGVYAEILISVTDGQDTVSLPVFSITVSDVNQIPTISGSAAGSVTTGEVYSFTPYAFDPDGDTLLFSITNQPAWAVFDNSTGTLSGTPETGDIGLYEDIIITVSDGTDTTALSAMSIMVDDTSAPLGVADLIWQIPITRTDGTPLELSEIDGYRIYMGSTSENLAMLVDLNDGSATSHSVTGLTTGIHYFAVTTYDIDGNESSYSNIAMKDIL